MTGVRRALFLSTGERYFAIGIHFLVVAIVSRILTPGEIGVSVVGLAIVGIAVSAREFASANFLIQRESLTPREIRAAFTVMLCLGAVISTALAVAAPLVADAYGEERLVPFLRVISASLMLELVAAPIVTLLRREMAFGRVAIINISGAATSAAVTVSLVWLGFSYMSFAWAWLASAVVTGVLAVAFRRQLWIYLPTLSGWRGMLTFGGYNGATVVFYRIYEAVPYLLLGRILSLDAAALYSRGLMICQLPDKVFLGGAMSVVLPAFSAEARGGRSLKQPYLRALGLITALQWPALMMLALLAYPVVALLLGDQWRDVAPLVQVIAFALLFSFSFELNYPVLVSAGAVRDVFLRALIVCPVSVTIMAVAAFFGLRAVAASLLVVIPFQALVSLTFVRRHVSVSWLDLGRAVWRSAVVTVLALAVPVAVVMAAGGSVDLPIVTGMLAATLALPGWLCGLWLTDHDLVGEGRNTLANLRDRIMRRGGLGLETPT